MTREEYDRKIQDKKYLLQQQKDRFVAYYHIGKSYIKSLEQRIAELEVHRTCEGCKYNRFGCDSAGVDVDCTSRNGNCARQWYKDYYEPKEQK